MKQSVSEVYLAENDPKNHATMKINGRLETFLLDSVATVNVLSKKTLDEFFSKNVVGKMEATNATLVMYNGSEIKPIGKTRLQDCLLTKEYPDVFEGVGTLPGILHLVSD
jgi:hypothetical protein